MDLINTIPSNGLVEEAVFDVLAGATRNFPTIDSLDWFGAKQSQFAGAGARQYGFPILDLLFRNPGVAGVELRYQVATQTLPEADPPVLTFFDHTVIGVGPGALESLNAYPQGFRLRGRFSRFQVVNVSAGNILGFYLWHSIRSN